MDYENNRENNRRPVDALADKTYSWWGKKLVFIMTKKIKTWQGVFALSLITGIIIAFIWTASMNIK